MIEETAGDGIEIVDPAYPTVENVKHILELNGLSRRKGESAVHQFYTTGDVGIFKRIGENLLGESLANLKRVHVHEIVEKR